MRQLQRVHPPARAIEIHLCLVNSYNVMNITKSGIIVGFLIGAVLCSSVWGYVLYSKMIALENQVEDLEQMYTQIGLTEFEREILFYQLKGARVYISYGNYTALREALLPQKNITEYHVSKTELRDLIIQKNMIHDVHVYTLEETLYYFREPWVGIYSWSPKTQR